MPPSNTPAHNLKVRRSGAVKRRSVLWRMRRTLYLLGLLGMAVFAGGLWAASQVQLPSVDPPTAQTSFICTAEVTEECGEANAVVSLHGTVNRVSVPLTEISPAMQAAVLAAEDRSFFTHGGVDPVGIARAAWVDIRGGKVSQGGSTLTQQYVKLTYLSQERTFSRKIKEAVLSAKLEQKLSKKEIFERYLNLVYFGRGAYGVQAAAHAYFGVDAKDLNLPQAATLAGIIRNPPSGDDPDKALRLRRLVLNGMLDANMIDEAQRAAADAQPLGIIDFTPGNGVNWLGGRFGATDAYGAQYFLDYVRTTLVKKLGFTSDQVYSGGLRIYTTLDPRLQKEAYKAVTTTLDWEGHPDGSLVAIDGKGRVVAMMGGTDHATNQVNLAVGADGGGSGRGAGSTFKTFALAEAVREGYSIGSIVPAPYRVVYTPEEVHGPDPWPVNSDCCDSGTTNLADGLKLSVNSAYAELMLRLGPDKVNAMAHRLGVRSPFDTIDGKLTPLPSHVLGTGAVSVLDMASAYSTFADNGIHIEPIVVTRVEDRNGNVLAEYNPKRDAVLNTEQNARVTYALQQVIEGGTGQNAALGRPAAGKTGTNGDGASDVGGDNLDAWFVGFVPRFTTAVWMGYGFEPNRTMPASIQGATYPAEIWRKFMSAAVANTDTGDFPEAEDLWGGEYLTSWGGYQSYSGSGFQQGAAAGADAPAPTTTVVAGEPSTTVVTTVPTTVPATTTPPSSAPPSTAPPPTG